MDIRTLLTSRKAVLHAAFWLAMMMIVFAGENWQYGQSTRWDMLPHFFFAFAVFAAISYYNIYRLVPRYLNKKRYLLYALLLIALLAAGAAVAVAAKLLAFKIGIAFPEGWQYADEDVLGYLEYFGHIFWGELMFILGTTFFFILVEWLRLQSVTIRLKEIEGEKMQSELQALKGQVNPHFLFNTLNNIYSHSLDNSPKTPGMILRLSSLMSYILYDCQEERVPAENELEFIKNYLELEKLRFEDQIDIQLSIAQEAGGLKIAPLLLIPFVENAFKHGGSVGTQLMQVQVRIEIGRSSLRFVADNTIDPDYERPARASSGIGIENARKRLSLLYPGRHQLLIEKRDGFFSVELTITEDEDTLPHC